MALGGSAGRRRRRTISSPLVLMYVSAMSCSAGSPWGVFSGCILKDTSSLTFQHESLYWSVLLTLILPDQVFDKLQLMVDCWRVFMNDGCLRLKTRQRRQSLKIVARWRIHSETGVAALCEAKWHLPDIYQMSYECFPSLWMRLQRYLLQPEVFHHLLLPVRPSLYTFDSRHYVQFVRLVWIASIFLVFFWPLSKQL